ncbi:SusC/RagA family TonB-linked outer membrane protein [Marivirga sp.]|uniref:SusC/RagA family TonB-linked outer membrane protein n=1 Tax=Marivirga sp. TaxID=2018662 RepID=UPI003DA77B31
MKRLFLLLLLVFFIGSLGHAQMLVKGKVSSAEDNDPLPGVSIQIEGTTKGTVTNIDGEYELQVENDDKIIFSFIGYKTQVINYSGQSTLNIAMEEDVAALEEVVVVGYGTQEKRDLTSSITTVDSEEITKTPTGQAMQALQGKVAGVQIVSNGAPGGSPTVRIRGLGSFPGFGDSSPLYVVDGMFFDDIDFLNTGDIQSMSVLKDASAAAIYGVRAANGVVIIETKTGKYNQKAEVTYDGYYGIQNPQNVLKMANTEQFTNYVLATGSSADASFINNAFNRFGRSRTNPNLPAVNTDWYDEVLQPAPMQNHTVNVTGGTDNIKYSVGASYFGQDGIVQNTRSEYDRTNFRTKVDGRVSDRLTVGANVNISNATRYDADNGVWFRTYFAVPILPVYDEQNEAARPESLSNAQLLGYRGSQNPYYNLLYSDNRNKISKMVGNFYFDYDIIPDKLSFKMAYNYSNINIDSRNVRFSFSDGVTNNPNSLSRNSRSELNEIWDNTLTYKDQIGKHKFTILGGYSYRSEVTEGQFVRGDSLSLLDPDEETTWFISLGDATASINSDGSGDFGSQEFGVSYFGRLSYSFDNKYLFYATVRRDGTNKFQQRFGTFPTFGAGWVVSEESFFDFDFVDFLKLRGSWGRLGNDAVNAAVGQPTRSTTTTAINDQLAPGVIVDNTFDLVEKWETVEETNFGITADFLSGRLSLEADYYQRDTKDGVTLLLLPAQRDIIRRNLAEIRNSGFESSINWSDKIGDKFTYNIGGNIATLNNEVLSLGGQRYLDAGSAEFRQRSIVGEAINAFFGYEVEGVFQTEGDIATSGYNQEFIDDNNLVPGDFKYKDQNGDGVIDSEDRVVLGSFLPSLTYGANLGLGYGKFYLSANIQGQSGHSILNRKRGEIIFTTDTNIDAELATNLWDGPGSSNRYPSAAGLRKGWNQNLSDYFVEDGSYFRIQNVRLSYQVGDQSIMGTEIPDITVYLTAERPLTVFDYNGFNPEVANGIDRQNFPISAVYSAGLRMKF